MLGPGNERNTGIMDHTQFIGVLGQLFSGTVKQAALDAICRTWAAEPSGFLRNAPVRYRQFAVDFDNVEVRAGPCRGTRLAREIR